MSHSTVTSRHQIGLGFSMTRSKVFDTLACTFPIVVRLAIHSAAGSQSGIGQQVPILAMRAGNASRRCNGSSLNCEAGVGSQPGETRHQSSQISGLVGLCRLVL